MNLGTKTVDAYDVEARSELCSLILRKSGGAFGDLPIVKAIIGCEIGCIAMDVRTHKWE